MRQPVGIPLVVERCDFIFENVIERFAVFVVLGIVIIGVLTVANGPAGLGVLHFAPPPIRDGKIDAPVDRDFHAGSPARFVRPPGIIEPDIHTLDEHPGHPHIVVFEENNLAPQGCMPGNFKDAANEFLPGFVRRMRLAGKNHLHRPRGVFEDAAEPIKVAE